VKLFTIKETAERTKWSTDFIRDEIHANRIAYHKIKGRYFLSEQDIADYIARSRVAALGERPLKRRTMEGPLVPHTLEGPLVPSTTSRLTPFEKPTKQRKKMRK